MLIYDADFVAHSSRADRVAAALPAGTEVVAWQSVELDRYGLFPADMERSLWWVSVDGTLHRGPHAVARALRATGARWSPLAWLLVAPGIRWATTRVDAVARRNLHRIPAARPPRATAQAEAPTR